MKEIPLTNSPLTAIVDDKDYERVAGRKWYLESRKGFVVGYISEAVGRRTMAMHVYLFDCPKGLVRDHINHNRRDNRRENIRICTNAENCRNSLPLKNTRSSKFKGVSWDTERSKWATFIKFNRKSIFLGRFKSETLAARAYDAAAQKYFGEFAFLNGV